MMICVLKIFAGMDAIKVPTFDPDMLMGNRSDSARKPRRATAVVVLCRRGLILKAKHSRFVQAQLEVPRSRDKRVGNEPDFTSPHGLDLHRRIPSRPFLSFVLPVHRRSDDVLFGHHELVDLPLRKLHERAESFRALACALP